MRLLSLTPRQVTDSKSYEKTRRVIRNAKCKPCADCDIQYPPYCMEFDHVRGEKKFNIAMHKGKTLEAIQEEIKKCDVVCANCHKGRTHIRRLHGISTTTH